jgi:phage FluMu gp28-like protein
VLTIARVLYPARDALVQEPRLEVVEQYAWTGEPHDALLRRLADLLREVWQVRRLAVDATGLGETLARLLLKALGSQVVRPVRFTAETKSRLGYGLLAAVNGGRLKLYAADGSVEYRRCRQELEKARVAYRANRTMNFFVDPADGHDDFLMSLALLVEASADAAPRAARGRIREL